MLRVGVLAVQGAVSEHLEALRTAAHRKGIQVETVEVRTPEELSTVQGLILPGGESTTMSRLLRSAHLQEPLVARARKGDLAVFGTCAGLILLSRHAQRNGADKDIQLLGLLDAEVDRNAFGRQKDSFEAELEFEGIGTIPAVFIRAPVLTKVSEPTKVMSQNKRGIVAVRKGLILGTAFHPELTPNTLLHELFLDLAQEAAQAAGETGPEQEAVAKPSRTRIGTQRETEEGGAEDQAEEAEESEAEGHEAQEDKAQHPAGKGKPSKKAATRKQPSRTKGKVQNKAPHQVPAKKPEKRKEDRGTKHGTEPDAAEKHPEKTVEEAEVHLEEQGESESPRGEADMRDRALLD